LISGKKGVNMKTKYWIIGSLVILAGVIIYIVLDLFSSKPVPGENPFEYGMEEIRQGDSAGKLYSETLQIMPGLQEIRGVAVGPGDRIYVTGTEGVEIYAPGGNILSHFAVDGNPGPVVAGRKGELWLGMEDHVELCDSAGRVIKKWRPAGAASIVTSLALTDQNLYVADAGNKVVYRYDLSGRLLNRIGEKDPQNSIPGFVIPSPYFDLAWSPDGSLWVVNPGRHQFEKYTPDGKLLSRWGEASNTPEGFCGCCNPSHFALLADGSFVTSEKGIERVKLYAPDGAYLGIVASPESFTEGTTGLDLAVDSQGRILVLDPEKRQIRIFEKIEGSGK
jgi:hypothetical protein